MRHDGMENAVDELTAFFGREILCDFDQLVDGCLWRYLWEEHEFCDPDLKQETIDEGNTLQIPMGQLFAEECVDGIAMRGKAECQVARKVERRIFLVDVLLDHLVEEIIDIAAAHLVCVKQLHDPLAREASAVQLLIALGIVIEHFARFYLWRIQWSVFLMLLKNACRLFHRMARCQ